MAPSSVSRFMPTMGRAFGIRELTKLSIAEINGERLTAEQMQMLIERAEADQLKKAADRLPQGSKWAAGWTRISSGNFPAYFCRCFAEAKLCGKVPIVKNSILIVAAVVTATALFAQNPPSDPQPTPQHMDKRIRVSERVLNDMALKRVLPQPPWSKDKSHEEGEVTVGVVVDYDGTVKTTHVMPGDPVLGDVAENAVKQWQFRPFILNGEPVQVDSRIVMKFSKKHAKVVVGER